MPSTDQVAAAIEGFFWPKIFWDFITLTLDRAVKPIPILQIINLILGIGMFALEWPMPFIAGTGFHRSLEVRLALLPLTALAAVLIYQATNAALYYVIGMMVYFWAYSEGEVSSSVLLGWSGFRGRRLLTFSDYLCEALDSTATWGARIKGLREFIIAMAVGRPPLQGLEDTTFT